MKKKSSLFRRVSVCFFALFLMIPSYLDFSGSPKADPFSPQVHASNPAKQDKTAPVGLQPFFQSPLPSASSPVLLPLVSEAKMPVKEYTFKKGDTLFPVLSRFGISKMEIFEITKAAKGSYNLERVLPGNKIEVFFQGMTGKMTTLVYEIDPSHHLKIELSNGQFIAVKEAVPLERTVERRAGVITDTLYQSANRFGVPVEVILDLSDIFSWDIDFGADIWMGDHFNIVYEVFKKEGKLIRSGRIVAAEIINRGKNYRAYYFAPESKGGDYYDETGRSLRKAFLKSPLRYRYISSGYARQRFHPILKINRPHLGIDFAARKGTPVRAAGDGVITYADWKGGHGKTVIIRHRNGYKTLYGHLSSFARGIKKGKKVTQSDFIGRVGSTGLSTGPHLHYTLFKNNRAINPKKGNLLRGKPLSQKWLPLFSEQVELMDRSLYPASEVTVGDDTT